MSAQKFPSIVREHFGIGFVEFFSGDFCDDILSVEDIYIRCIASACQDVGVSICAIAARNDLSSPNSDEVMLDVKRLKRWIELSSALGHKVVRINAGLSEPSPESMKRVREQILPLLDFASQYGVDLAIENHPHIVENATDLDPIIQLVDELSERGLHTCPDSGAFSDNYRVRGFERMAEYAAHVHLKPEDQRPNDNEGSAFYRPFLDALKKNGYNRHLSIEHVELDNPDADPFLAVWRVARDVSAITEESIATDLPRGDAILPKTRSKALRTAAPKKRVQLPEGIVTLALEGCESRLGVPIRLRTFPDGAAFVSPGCPHVQASSRLNFCGLAGNDAQAQKQCTCFYEREYSRIREHCVTEMRVSFCPLGLVVLFAPLVSSHALYGAVACGAWRESGTEGVILYGINRWIRSEKLPRALVDTLRDIPSLTAGRLAEVRKTVEGVVENLSRFLDLEYKDDLAHAEAEQIRIVSNTLRHESLRSLRTCVPMLSQVLSNVANFLKLAYICVYASGPPNEASTLTLEKLAVGLFGRKPRLQNCITIKMDDLPTPDFFESEELFFKGSVPTPIRALSSPQVSFCYPFRLTEDTFCLIVGAARRGHGRPGDDLQFLDRFLGDVGRALRSAAMLDEALDHRERLAIYADQTRHELDGPLLGLTNALGRLKRLVTPRSPGGALQAQVPKILETTERAVSFGFQAGTIVNTLSRASLEEKVEHARERRHFRYAHLGRIIQEAAMPYLLVAKERGFDIKIPGSVHALPQIQCDKHELTILFANLFSNAVKFSHYNRDVEVSGRTLYSRSREEVQLTVRDFGLGIPEGDLTRIFERYYQSEIPDEIRPIGGTGLGLFVCRVIVEHHGGTIRATSEFRRKTPWRPIREQLQGCWVDFITTLPRHQTGVIE